MSASPDFGAYNFAGSVEYVGQQIDAVARTVTARVRLKNRDGLLRLGLFGTGQVSKGTPDGTGPKLVVGRSSVHALYDERFVTFGEDDVYQQSDAAGFIRLFALPARVRALKDQELAARQGDAAEAKAEAAKLSPASK